MSTTPRNVDPLAPLLDQLLAQVRAGNEPSIGEVCDAHPDLAPRIRELLPTMIAMERLKPKAIRMHAEQISPCGTRIGDYRILREVGRGGMGIVYEAVQVSLGRHVALKVIAHHMVSDAAAIARFHREARAVARLHHTNIVSVYEIGQHEDKCFYAMQFIDGEGLDDWIRRMRSIRCPTVAPTGDEVFFGDQTARTQEASTATRSRAHDDDPSSSGSGTRRYANHVAHIGLQIAEALQYAHDKGIIHRDIKPSNLLIDQAGTAWITDFGLAQVEASDDDDATRDQLTMTGDIVGTVRYMAPERIRGQHDLRGDIYGLGITLYELLALRPAFATTDRVHLLEQIARTESVALRGTDPWVPRDLETIIGKAMAKEPELRYGSAQAMADDLRLFLEDRPIRARRSSGWERSLRWCRRNPVVAGLVALVALLAAVLGVGAPVMHVVRTERDRAVRAEQEAKKNQSRAERAEREVKIRSHLAQATIYRRSGRMGQRFLCLAELTAAARLDPPAKLRQELHDEAIAALGLTDLKVRVSRSVGQLHWPQLDRQLRRYAYVDLYRSGEAVVCSLEDKRELVRIPRPDVSFWHATVDFTPDGQYLWICYFPRAAPEFVADLHVWRLDPLEQLLAREIRSADIVGAVATHGGRLYFVNPKLELCAWDLKSRREVQRIPLGMVPYALCLDREGRRMAANNFGSPLIRILDLETAAELASWTEDAGTYDLAWSADGQLIASGHDFGRIVVQHVPDGELVSELDGEVIHIDFARRGHLLATSGWTGMTQLWDALSGTKLVESQAQMVQFSQDDRQLAYYHGKRIGIWDVAHGRELRAIRPAALRQPKPNDQFMLGASFSSDKTSRRMLATYGKSGAWLWDSVTGNELAHLPCGETSAVLFCEDGSGLVTNCSLGGLYFWPLRRKSVDRVEQIEVGPPRLLQSLGSKGFSAATLLANGRSVAVADNANQRVVIVSLDDPKEGDANPIVLPSQHGRITSISASPDGRWLAAGGWKEKGIQVWNLRDRRLDRVLPPGVSQTATAFWVYFSPDNRWLLSAAASDEHCGYLAYRVGSWDRDMTWPAEYGAGIGVAFSREGGILALGASPNQVLISDATGRELMRLTSRQKSGSPAAVSDDGVELVANGYRQPMMWWNLRRIEAQLRALGLAPPTTDSSNAGREPPSQKNGSTLAHRDPWNVDRREAARLSIVVDAGDFPQRIAAQQRAESIATSLRMARLLQQTQKWREAQARLEDDLESYPDAAGIENELARLLVTRPDGWQADASRAVQLAKHAVQSRPDQARYRHTLGIALYRGGEWQAAIDEFTRAGKLKPPGNVAESAFFLAMAHQQLGDETAAREWYEKAMVWLTEHQDAQDNEQLRKIRAEAEKVLGDK